MVDARPHEQPWAEWIRERDDWRSAHGKPEALDDLTVLDLSSGHLGGCFCSSILAEFGAEVIRIEPPGGDLLRRFSPFGYEHQDTGLAYLVEGRNKFHVTLNLRRPEGRRLLARLASKADVLIETFPAGQMDAWRIGYRQLSAKNPRLVYCALTSYGQFGPKARAGARKPSYDVTEQALSGVVHITGEMASGPKPKPWEAPTKIGGWFAWYAAGAWAAFGILTALQHRAGSGTGQLVDTTGAEGIMRYAEDMVLWYEKSGTIRERIGSLDASAFPYTFVRSKGGYTMLAGFSDPNFTALTTIMGRPELKEDARFKTFLDRAKLPNKKVIHDALERWSSRYTSEEILEKVQDYMLNRRGPGTVATGPVNTPTDVLHEENWWERGALQRLTDPEYGDLVLQGQPWKMTETPPRLRWACRPVGKDNASVYLKYLGIGRTRLQALRKQQII
jgi:crotonobetainyl-CoA:carnitine CoA-transferase CaiB-like acyl-CoA transferase